MMLLSWEWILPISIETGKCYDGKNMEIKDQACGTYGDNLDVTFLGMKYLMKNKGLFRRGIFSGIEMVFFEMPQRIPQKMWI